MEDRTLSHDIIHSGMLQRRNNGLGETILSTTDLQLGSTIIVHNIINLLY